jgi:dienelactone hydrolase
MRCTKLILAGVCSVFGLAAQALTITPGSVLIDESASIRASGLRPSEHITISADLVDGDDQRWESTAEFVADAQGDVDVSTQAPVAGSYQVVSAMGLIWSMKPASKGVGLYRPPKEQGPQQIHFALSRDGHAVATAQLEQRAMGEGVREVKVTGVIHGVLFVPAGSGPFPGVLVLGGSEGGVPRRRASWLASRGFAAFALAYFRYENLPQQLEAIPLEYFGQALVWMRKRPEIQPNKLAVMGVSRGGELALQLGSMYPAIKTVVAYVPANARHRACCGGNMAPWAWTWQGSPLAYAERKEGSTEDLLAMIMVEHTSGPILLIAGEQDHVWDSAPMAESIVSRLKRAHFAYAVENLTYPHAGHIAGRPEIVPEWHGRIAHTITGRSTDYGGTPEGNALSSIDAIPKVLEFLRRNLGGEASPN